MPRAPDQTYYDALLIRSWRRDLYLSQFCHLIKHEFGVYLEELPLLRNKGFRPKKCTLRAWIAVNEPRLNDRLWNCSTDQDFVQLLHWLKTRTVEDVPVSASRYTNEVANKTYDDRDKLRGRSLVYSAFVNSHRGAGGVTAQPRSTRKIRA